MHSTTEEILATLVIAVFLGILAQVVAHRLKLPAILPLLLIGMAAGPFGLEFLHPETLGGALEAIIHLGVAVILFEGGLSLDLGQLQKVGRTVRNLLSVGVFVTWIGAAWLAHWLGGVEWSTAVLFGAIVTVTGPTVVAPLLRHMIAPRRVRTILLSEGLMIDPIGAVLAYLVLQTVSSSQVAPDWHSMIIEIFTLVLVGSVLGYAAAAIGRLVSQNRRVAGELRNLVVLALLLGAYLVAEQLAPQSGIVAAVVMGLAMSFSEVADVHPLKAFKEQLTVLIISVLFVLLSGQLDLGAIVDLGWRGLAVALGLILIVRPLSVLASVIPPSRLSWREKVVLGLTAPRGIVAAAVASLAAIQLREGGQVQAAANLEGLTYLVILLTCTWATAMAIVLPRILGYLDDPSRRLLVFVGSNTLSTRLALEFKQRGWTSLVIDSDQEKLDQLAAHDIVSVRGDARATETYQVAGIERDSRVLALTANDELNLLVAELVRDEFGVEHPIVAMQRPAEDLGRLRKAWLDLLGNRPFAMTHWCRLLENCKAQLATVAVPTGPQRDHQLRDLLLAEDSDLRLICAWKDERPNFEIDLEELSVYSELTLLATTSLFEQRLNAILTPPPDEPLEGGERVAGAAADEGAEIS